MEMLKKIKTLTKDFKLDVKNLKKLILKKKAGADKISYLKINYLLKLLEVILREFGFGKKKMRDVPHREVIK
jgi:hypothetical protein